MCRPLPGDETLNNVGMPRKWWHWIVPFVWRDNYENALAQLQEAHEKNSALEKSRDCFFAALQAKDERIRDLKHRADELEQSLSVMEDENQRLRAQLEDIGLKRGRDGKFKSRQ